MPKLSLVVCLHGERDLLARLLERAGDCYDDLVVVHDGPDERDVRSVVEGHRGRFFERPRQHAQEPHWPFAWGEAKHDWILRWDADEFPGAPLVAWLQRFREQPEPPVAISGYTCAWPLWDGRQAITKRWPRRVCLINRQRVRYFGMAEQEPIADQAFVPLDLVLHHQPSHKNYGIDYVLRRPKVRRWHTEIAKSLLNKPTDLACWRWNSPDWPRKWEQIRRRPLRTALARLVFSTTGNAREMIAHGQFPWPSFVIHFPLQHWMVCMSYLRASRARRQRS